MKPFTIVGIGEALFDLLPDREVLGGAPLNVVVHAQQLAVPLGGRAVMVSRVGADERGQRLRANWRRAAWKRRIYKPIPTGQRGPCA